MMKHKAITQTQKENILSMRSKGISLDTIAKALDIPYHQVQSFVVEFEWQNKIQSQRDYYTHILKLAELRLFGLAELIRSSDDSDRWHYEKQFKTLMRCYASADLNNLQVYLPV